MKCLTEKRVAGKQLVMSDQKMLIGKPTLMILHLKEPSASRLVRSSKNRIRQNTDAVYDYSMYDKDICSLSDNRIIYWTNFMVLSYRWVLLLPLFTIIQTSPEVNISDYFGNNFVKNHLTREWVWPQSL